MTEHANEIVKLYVCYEPDQLPIAERLDGWAHTNADRDAYDARLAVRVDSPEAEPIKDVLRRQIHEADVTICIIGQTAFLNEWITWELNTAKAKPERNAFVGIILHDFYTHPAPMVDSGTMFVPFKRDALEDAVQWAIANELGEDDFILED